jgi:hypothetical protein
MVGVLLRKLINTPSGAVNGLNDPQGIVAAAINYPHSDMFFITGIPRATRQLAPSSSTTAKMCWCRSSPSPMARAWASVRRLAPASTVRASQASPTKSNRCSRTSSSRMSWSPSMARRLETCTRPTREFSHPASPAGYRSRRFLRRQAGYVTGHDRPGRLHRSVQGSQRRHTQDHRHINHQIHGSKRNRYTHRHHQGGLIEFGLRTAAAERVCLARAAVRCGTILTAAVVDRLH